MGTIKSRAPAKPTTSKVQPLPEKTFIVDNGAYTIKAGYAAAFPPPEDEAQALSACVTIPNALAKTRGNRVFIGSQLSTHISDWNEATFRRPVEKGYIVNWEAQKEIWEHSFFDEKTAWNKEVRITDPENTTLLLTEAPNCLPALQKNADEIIMEEWSFGMGKTWLLGVKLRRQKLFGESGIERVAIFIFFQYLEAFLCL